MGTLICVGHPLRSVSEPLQFTLVKIPGTGARRRGRSATAAADDAGNRKASHNNHIEQVDVYLIQDLEGEPAQAGDRLQLQKLY